MCPLFKYSLDESTGNINVVAITDYEEKHTSIYGTGSSKKYWRYKGNYCWMYAYEEKLDKFISGHIYSFNSDIDAARNIIYSAILAKYNKANADAERWSRALRKLNGIND